MPTVHDDELQFAEAGICAVKHVRSEGEWRVVNCDFRGEAARRPLTIRMSLQERGKALTFSADKPREIDWLPRRLVRCR